MTGVMVSSNSLLLPQLLWGLSTRRFIISCGGGARRAITSCTRHGSRTSHCDAAAHKGCWWCGVGCVGARLPRLLLSSSNNIACSDQQWRCYRAGQAHRSIRQNDDKPEPPKTTPQLMDFPWVIWPSLWHTIRNWIFSNFLIYRYLDQEFSLSSFKAGATQALVYVSKELSMGNFDALEELITKPTLEEIRRNFARLSLKQRLDLAVAEDDIFLSFPYQIGIIFTNEGSKNERIFVEVTMCYHIFRDFQDFVKSKTEGTISGGFKGVYDNHDRISIANYRFIREFTRGVDDGWRVSLANHFKPGEVVQER